MLRYLARADTPSTYLGFQKRQYLRQRQSQIPTYLLNVSEATKRLQYLHKNVSDGSSWIILRASVPVQGLTHWRTGYAAILHSARRDSKCPKPMLVLAQITTYSPWKDAAPIAGPPFHKTRLPRQALLRSHT